MFCHYFPSFSPTFKVDILRENYLNIRHGKAAGCVSNLSLHHMGIPGNTGVLVVKRADQCLSICTLSIIHGLGVVINRFLKKVLSYFHRSYYIEDSRFRFISKLPDRAILLILSKRKNIR
ncbi:hypothetical protein CAX48_12890 [Listeria monocytogenes]|nr:hypothetical protein [Listeria monocytogenes]EAG8561338.1 hypothetical protein [Listeria monocytogenes]EBH4175947.1 hypothetical protein [Listeria monocytogenes]